MRSLIRKCRKCNIYTLEEICPKCGGETVMAIPMKYSPADKFQKYRIKMKESDNNGENNI